MSTTSVVHGLKSYTLKHTRITLSALFLLLAGMALWVNNDSRAATPASGTLSEANPRVTWNGPIKAPTGSADCGGPNSANCDNFNLTVQAPSAAYGPFLVEIKLQPELLGDWDMQVYGPSGTLVDGSGNSPGQTELVVLINPPPGTYTISAAPFAPVTNTTGNSYTASAELKHHVVNSAAQGSDTNVKYQNFVAPSGMGEGAGEPSIGANWLSGRAMYIANRETLRVTFDDTTIPAKATWENKSAVFTSQITMDPILFTDPRTGRTIVSQLVTPAAVQSLAVLTDGCSLSAFTDDDGDTWVVDQGCGLPSGADHQSVGGGPFAQPLPNQLPAGYPHAVYYCAQSGVTAYCSRSDDGGLTFGPGVPIYVTECGGLHGHPMVGPDGAVYVPNKACGGKQGVAVSEDNGLTWSVRTVPGSLPSSNDPGLGIGAQGTLYFGYQNGDGRPTVSVSHDRGRSWMPAVDVGTPYGIKNTAFPRVVAGDDDRAAFAFLGTPTGGSFQDAGFTGEWHLYIAHTYDGGAHWTTIDATPTDPVQRGCIWMQGGSNPCRNLLDFMGSTVDKFGRVLIGYADGCINCPGPSTSRAKKATIARQVTGRRLFAQYDPSGDPSPTPTPTATPTPSPTPTGPATLHFHGNPTDDSSCTGSGSADLVACDGPFLSQRETLGTGAPGHWDVPQPGVDGTADRNIYDPNWIWSLAGPTTLRGDMVVKWWATCGACGPAGLQGEWDISLWADGAKVLDQHVVASPALPNVPSLLTATINIPTSVTAASNFVLQIDPAFIDSQSGSHIYYDSQQACPGSTGSEPCDSRVVMPVVDANSTPTPTPTPTSTPTPTPGPTPGGSAPRYINYYPPAGTAEDFGEPSIGANWQSGSIMFFGGFSPYALRVRFDDSTSPANVIWDQTQLRIAATPRVAGDPILFTDRVTGRTFVSQLFGLTPFNGMDYTDDDGATYLPSTGSGIGSGIDHQTVGGGPFHAPVPTGAAYPHAVYYCAQDGVNSADTGIANCALSIDGGNSFGPAVPVYALGLNSCFPLHGHIKIAPDGTAYLPNRKCGAGAGLVVSEDNGITWSARTVPNSTVGDSDASIGIASDGTIFLGYEGSDGHARIATSHDKGLTWINHTDVGAQLGLQNAIFPAVVAGDGNEQGADTARAAFAFYGSTSPGDQDSPDYRGNWYLYVATTFDDGKTWTTVNATPNDPIQRDGICTRGFQGCAVPRNLLDFFDATVDKEGRVLVGYQDGCMGECVTGGPNLNTAKGVIARQSGGRRMLAAYDQAEPGLPGSPLVTASVNASHTSVQLSWPVPDSGGSAISAYRIYRRVGTAGFSLLTSVTQTSYLDSTFDPAVQTFYRVTAVNSVGEGPGVEVSTSSTPSACVAPGIQVIDDTLTGGADNDSGQNTPPEGSVNVKQLYVAEPFSGTGVNKLIFTLKVAPTSLPTLPPNSQWFIIWNRLNPDSDFDRWYVAMRTDATGLKSFEYGKVGVPLPPIPPSEPTVPNPNANTPVLIGAADGGSYDPATGVITITISNSKAENIHAGQSLTDLNVRTYLNRPEPGQRSQNNASDITANSGYTLVGNESCQASALLRNSENTNRLASADSAAISPTGTSRRVQGFFRQANEMSLVLRAGLSATLISALVRHQLPVINFIGAA